MNKKHAPFLHALDVSHQKTMNDEKRYLQLLGKVLSKEASKEEQQELEEWGKQAASNKQFIEETTSIWTKAAAYGTNIATNKETAWARLEREVDGSMPSKQLRIRTLWYAVAAAILVVGIGLSWLYQQEGVLPEVNKSYAQGAVLNVTTTKGEQKEITLPDGSTVVLNEGSTLSYKLDFQPRLVNLEGEAFFDITKQQGKSFEILTTETRTTVLGTSFNVRAYANQATEIAVVTGKVAFEPLDNSKKERILLLPQEMASHNKEEGITKQGNSNNALAWKTQELQFDNQRLSEVLSVLERYYGVSIEGSEGLLNCHYTGNFSKVKLEEVLNTIAFTFPTKVNIEKTNDQYALIGQGCD
ncbi:MAG: FecR family protein [Aureispira sp.]